MFINMFSYAQDRPKTGGEIKPEKVNDSVSVNLNTIINTTKKDSTLVISEKGQDTVKVDSVKPNPEFLTAVVTYKATDYTSFNRKEQKLYLYNEAEIYYEDMEIKAGIIVIDYSKNEVYAGRIKDSLGNFLISSLPSPIIISSVKVAMPVTPKVPDTVELPTISISVAVNSISSVAAISSTVALAPCIN